MAATSDIANAQVSSLGISVDSEWMSGGGWWDLARFCSIQR